MANEDNDKIGNHPETQRTKDVCNISENTAKTKQVCKPLNQAKKNATSFQKNSEKKPSANKNK